MFGSEPPLYLKPVGRRGRRRHEADALQHYAGYRHPLDPDPGAAPDPGLGLGIGVTAAQELRRDREAEAARRERNIAVRRARHVARESERARRRDEEFVAEQRHIAEITGLSLRNEPGDGRDTITRQFRSLDARRHHEYKDARQEHFYFARQQELVRRNNPHGYNIITGQHIPEVAVPPPPQAPPPTEFEFR